MRPRHSRPWPENSGYRLDTHTVDTNYRRIRKFALRRGINAIIQFVVSTPYDARSYWNTFVLSDVTAEESWALRAMVHSLCRLNIGSWSPAVRSIVRGLKSPKVDKYRTVRIGDCFLPVDQQSLIVNYLDDMCASLAASPGRVGATELRDSCMLVMSYQYGFRPGQQSRVRLADVRLFETGAVHVVVRLAKQRDKNKRIEVRRRIKREWAPLFAELVERRKNGEIEDEGDVPPALLFGLTPSGVSWVIMAMTELLTGKPWTPTELRHTAAQRLADGGTSHAALSEFLGQTSTRIANVYFDNSPAQAQRVNEALAISQIYSNVANIARTKTIDKPMLLGLPTDQQIGAVPHGIPISGIGGCGIGQSLCLKNPVLSCYDCIRFMPLNHPDIHQQVLDDLRPVVTEFAAASRSNEQSPAYAQLKATLHAVRRVVEDLKSDLDQEEQG